MRCYVENGGGGCCYRKEKIKPTTTKKNSRWTKFYILTLTVTKCGPAQPFLAISHSKVRIFGVSFRYGNLIYLFYESVIVLVVIWSW
jgi:hypothetical protein